jgi:hypothetical protein
VPKHSYVSMVDYIEVKVIDLRYKRFHWVCIRNGIQLVFFVMVVAQPAPGYACFESKREKGKGKEKMRRVRGHHRTPCQPNQG